MSIMNFTSWTYASWPNPNPLQENMNTRAITKSTLSEFNTPNTFTLDKFTTEGLGIEIC